MEALEALLAVVALKDLHGVLLGLLVVIAVSAVLLSKLRSRKRSPEPYERDQERGA